MIALMRLFGHDSDEPICLEVNPIAFAHRIALDQRTYHHVGSPPASDYDTRKYACAWDFGEESELQVLDLFGGPIRVPLSETKRVRRKP